MIWRSAEELETAGSFFTDDLQFSGDGYVLDWPMSSTSESFIEEFNRVIPIGFWEVQTAMYTFTFNSYEPSLDRFVIT